MYYVLFIIIICLSYRFYKSYKKWKIEEDKKDVELVKSASWSLYRGVCKNTKCTSYEKLLPLKKVVYDFVDKYGEDNGRKMVLLCSICGKETDRNIVLGWTTEQVNEKMLPSY